MASEALEELTRLDPPPSAECVRQFRAMIDAVPEGKMTQPEGAAGWNTRGATLMEVGKVDDARVCFAQALDLDADYEPAWLNLALSFGRVRDFEPALTVLDRYLGDYPSSEQGWHLRGMALANLERHEEAVSSYARALKINPRLVEALRWSSAALLRLGRNPEALDACRRGLEIAPADLELLFFQSKALHRLGREAEALQCTAEMKRLDPEKARALLEADP
ncbi:MAG: tetratricopeptide repeat protein [Verrucomicrobiae bacterium]|nr:tetratricopeptide repeat protein [Verrucomicrobiae bacterium]